MSNTTLTQDFYGLNALSMQVSTMPYTAKSTFI